MKGYQRLTHTTWDCKYRVVFISKKRKKMIFGAIRKHLGKVLHDLVQQKGCEILEGHLMLDQGEGRAIDSATIYGKSKKLYG
ncbi:transposase IS200 family protein [Nitrosomonas sp. Nm84]|nr:transposase IS200 family protein [Nitrosomonas sp. Nm84]